MSTWRSPADHASESLRGPTSQELLDWYDHTADLPLIRAAIEQTLTGRAPAPAALDADALLAEAREAAKGERYNGVYQRGYFDGAYKYAPTPAGLDDLREAAVAVCQLWFTDNAPDGSQHIRKAMLDLREALDRIAAAPAPAGLATWHQGDWRHATWCEFERGGNDCSCGLEDFRNVDWAATPAPAGLDDAVRLVDSVIFDLPIGEDVTYSRGYSAGIAAARESLREALARLAESREGEEG